MEVPPKIKKMEEQRTAKIQEKVKAVSRQDYEDAAKKRDEILEWNKFVRILGYKFWDETQNDTYRLFLGASD